MIESKILNKAYVDEALDDFSRALALAPDHKLARESIKQLQLVDENVPSSIERLKRLIRFCPDLAQPYRDLAFCYSELGQYGLAQESYKKAMMLDIEAKSQVKPATVLPSPAQPQSLIFSHEDVSLFANIFKGCEDFFARQWIDVSFFSMGGRLKGKLIPVESKNVFLRLAQYDRYKDEEFKLMIARSIIDAKMINQRTLILRYQRNHPEADISHELEIISNSISSAPEKNTIAALMGLEGISSAAYFRCYSGMLSGILHSKKEPDIRH